MVSIVQRDNPVLREVAKPVTEEMFDSAELRKVIRQMKTALASQDDGVAIAAPQIGVSLRIFVVAGKVLELLYPKKEKAVPVSPKKYPDMVFINPKIVKISKERDVVEEGCLSVRYLYGKTERAKKAKVKAFDEKGVPFEMGGSGLLAQIFQHEIDHLEGILFIDHAFDVEDLPPEPPKM